MKILVLNNMVPFLKGGAERLADQLVRHLRRYGHDADLLRIPFRWDPVERLYDEVLACRMMRLYNVDRVIGLKFPAYLIPHAHKTLWIVHQFRQAYDLRGTDYTNVPDSAVGDRISQWVRAADEECFESVQKTCVISQVVQQRLAINHDRESDVIHPPLDDASLFQPEPSRDYIFCGGRINYWKRQHLLIQAMRQVRSKVRLVIAGPADKPSDAKRLEELVKKHRLQDRVELQFGFHPREHLARLVGQSLACAYVPYDEDYGYVTLEAFYGGKPVLTTNDAGGVLDFVVDRRTGRVTQPDSRSLAQAMDELYEDRQTTRRYGEAAREDIHARAINWPTTVQRLVA